jgi:hypothetical protein
MLFDNVYIKHKQLNGDILLVKQNLYAENAAWTMQTNGDILLKHIIVVELKDLPAWNFLESTIQKVIAKASYLILDKPSFKTVCDLVHDLIGDGVKIIKHSILNIKTVEDTSKGWYWYPKLGISIKKTNANKTLLEIITQCKKNNIALEITILVGDQTIKIIV